MSVPYISCWMTPSIGPDEQIDKFWKTYEKDSIVVNGVKCLYFQEICDFSPVHTITNRFADIVFFALVHIKIDTNIGWTNELFKGEDAVIVREEDGEDWRPAVCDGLTIMYVGYDNDDPKCVIDSMRRRGAEIK